MAGSGRRVFQPGEVLTASNVMNYLQDQAVQVFAGTAARGSAIGTAVSEGMVSYLKDSHKPEVYNGSAWSALAYATAVPTLAGVGLVPIIAPTVNYSGGTATANSLGTISFSAVTSISLNSVFTSAYANYKIIFDCTTNNADAPLRYRMRASGTDNTTNNYVIAFAGVRSNGSAFYPSGTADFGYLNTMAIAVSNGKVVTEITILRPALADLTQTIVSGYGSNSGTQLTLFGGNVHNVSSSFDGITIYPSAGAITGTIQVFGYNS